ncbi:MAG: peptidylprolyl isomerase [Clostridia bacterium]|nr:peptidylprolyl isomerase [Clostridia bacterium]
MRKKSLLALLLALVMVLSGCALDVVDEEKDMARTVIDVNGETISKRVITNAVNSQYQNYSMYYQYGLLSSMPTTAEITEQVINSYVSNLVQKQKALAQGFDQLTEEEQAAVEETAKSNYDTFLQSVISSYLSDSELQGDELNAEAAKYVEDNGITTADGRSTLEDFIKSAKEEKAIEKLQASITDTVTVSEEELQADFDSHVEGDKASFTVSEEDSAAGQAALTAAETALTEATAALEAAAEDADKDALQAAVDAAQEQVDAAQADIDSALKTVKQAYEQARSQGKTVYYNLPGYRKVQHILIPFSSDDETSVAAQAALTEARDALNAAQTALDEAAEDADKAALQAAVNDAQEKVDAAEHGVADASEAAKAATLEKAQEVYKLATAADADFDALIAEYNEDNSSAGTYYYVSADSPTFVEGFVKAAMSVENIGDVSEPTESVYGYHIVKYIEDVAEGAVSLDDVREELEAHVLSEMKEEALDSAIAEWTKEANVKTYPEKM